VLRQKRCRLSPATEGYLRSVPGQPWLAACEEFEYVIVDLTQLTPVASQPSRLGAFELDRVVRANQRDLAAVIARELA
jgi:hypothetical protein